MNARIWVAGMLAGTALVIALGGRERPEAEAAQVTPPAVTEPPWLSREAGSQLIGPGARPGPLFDGVHLGGLAPSPEVRARIDAFARANDIDVDDEIVTAVRVEVAFRGGYGYEGADVFALRLNRRHTGGCGSPRVWVDDWVYALEDGIHLRARVVENKVIARWQPLLTSDGMLDEAEALLGRDRAAVARAAGDRWRELEPSKYLLELPYAGDEGYWRPSHLGVTATTHAGRIHELTVPVRTDYGDPAGRTVREILEARWGNPRVRDDVATWTRPDRVITAELEAWNPTVTMRAR